MSDVLTLAWLKLMATSIRVYGNSEHLCDPVNGKIKYYYKLLTFDYNVFFAYTFSHRYLPPINIALFEA